MIKRILLSSALLGFGQIVWAADTPEQAVSAFYQALASQQCDVAVQLRTDYTPARCHAISQVKLGEVNTLATEGNQAVVSASVNYASEGKAKSFNGFMLLTKGTNGWLLTNTVAESSAMSKDSFIAAHLSAGKTATQTVVSTIPDVVELNAPQATLSLLAERFPVYAKGKIALVDISEQRMGIFENGQKLADFPISSATAGAGNQAGSDQTPLGAHRISQKIGDNAAKGAIFEARRDTGKIANILQTPEDVPTDYVTTRIMWLDGLETGKNKEGQVDSKNRYIYIHGTPEEGLIGKPASHGCIRMKNDDVIKLYELLTPDTLVYIGA